MTATLPTSFFEGKTLEEGTRCEIEIVKVDGDSAEVRYIPHEVEEEPVESPDAQIDRVAEAREASGAY